MLYIDFEGETVEEATQQGLKELNLDEKDVQIEVIRSSKRGVFGLGKKTEAKVRIHYKENGEIEDLLNSIKVIIGYLDREAKVVVNMDDQPPTIDISHHREGTEDGDGEYDTGSDRPRYRLMIDSKNIAHIIGKHGSHLQSLQTLVNALLQKYGNRYKVIVNVDKYTQVRNDFFLKWVKEQISIVLKNKRHVILKSLNSYKRRIIHLEVQKNPNLISQSKGEGKMKNIKITYVTDKENYGNR